MSRKSDPKARVSLFMLVTAFFAVLAQVDAAYVQTSVNEQASVLSPLPFIDAPYLDTNSPASTGPALLALADVAGTAKAAAGGLWVSGDNAEGVRYLQWIAGNQPAGLLKIDNRGKISFNLRILSEAASIASENTADQRERIASFVRSDEGLLLLAQVTNGAYRFCLHIGPKMPTLAGNIKNDGVCNLDNRFDSRINPVRRSGRKADNECPPEGFDSLIAINPDARWFNLYNEQLIPLAQMAFHEMAEAHARLVLGFDYLPQGDKPGAHDTAIEREIRLKHARPKQTIIMPIGANVRLISRDDWLMLFDVLQMRKGRRSFKAY